MKLQGYRGCRSSGSFFGLTFSHSSEADGMRSGCELGQRSIHISILQRSFRCEEILEEWENEGRAGRTGGMSWDLLSVMCWGAARHWGSPSYLFCPDSYGGGRWLYLVLRKGRLGQVL